MKLLYIGMCTGDNGFTKALRKHFAYCEINCGIDDVNNVAIKVAAEFEPDIIFLQVQTPNIIHIETIYILNTKSWVCNFTGDVRVPIPSWYIETGFLCHMSFFTNETDVKTLNDLKIPAAYLNLGFDDEIYTPAGDKHPVKDIVFMANNYPGQFALTDLRAQVVETLRQFSFALYGNGWIKSNGHFNGFQEMEAGAYRGCKIAINCSHYDLERYSSDRILRIMGSGAFCLSKWFPGYEKDYTDKKHLVIWNTLDELVDMCKYYLTYELERGDIATDGCALVHGRDTFNHMAENIKSFYEKGNTILEGKASAL